MKIPASIINEKINDKAFTFYIGMKLYCTFPGGYYSVKEMYSTLLGSTTISRDLIKLGKEMLQELVQYGLIELQYNVGGTFSATFIDIDDTYYGSITTTDYIKLLRNGKHGAIKLLVLLNKSLYNKENIQLPETYFAKELGKSTKTISEYINTLVEYKIIKVTKPGVKQVNIYSHY